MRNEAEAGRAVEKYADIVRRICFMHLKNYSDVEDVFQEVFLKYILHDQPFENDEHERAWLIRVAIKDVIYLFYYEGYSAVEIAKMLRKKIRFIHGCRGQSPS